MEKLPICRICLVQNVRMYIVVNKNLQELYEKLTDIPFVTEDRRPILACFVCCTKLKQRYQLLRKCLESEEQFVVMMNEDYEPNLLITQDSLDLYCGFIKSPVIHLSIVDELQTETYYIPIKQELIAVSEGLDDIIGPKEEHQSDELEPENSLQSYLVEEDTPAHHSESDSEDDIPLMEFKTEVVEEEAVPKKEKKARETKKLEPENSLQSYLVEEDTPAHHSESDSEDDIPIMEFKTEVVEEALSVNKQKARETKRAILAKKQKQDNQRKNPEDPITPKETTKEKSDSKVNRTNQRYTSTPGTYFKEPFKCDQRTHTGEKLYECDICQRNFKQKSHLKIHIRIHTAEKPYKCDICERSFNQKNHLTTHMRIHTGVKPYKCDVCHCRFKQRGHLNFHMRLHTGEKPYKCDICGGSFSQRGVLTQHVLIHTGEKPYKCDSCERSFNQRNHLTTHMRIHTGVKPYKCDVCQCSFKQRGNLNGHMRIHTGEKPYKCHLCDRSFSQRGDLTRHVNIHTGERPYKCLFCQRSFNHSSNLRSHIRIHTGDKPYKCDVCELSFYRKSYLTKHLYGHVPTV